MLMETVGVPGLGIALEVDSPGWPEEEELRRMASLAFAAAWGELNLRTPAASEVSLLFTGDARMRRINAEWRGVDKPTNVLSFPTGPNPGDGSLPPLLGDIVLSAETLAREADLENRPFAHHLSHLMVHGLLHLLGYDHQTDEEAEEMERLEAAILARLDIPDPYGRSETDRY
jgi:probable rRNA maturation factor